MFVDKLKKKKEAQHAADIAVFAFYARTLARDPPTGVYVDKANLKSKPQSAADIASYEFVFLTLHFARDRCAQ